LEILNGKYHWEDLSEDRRIILKIILGKDGGGVHRIQRPRARITGEFLGR
jgi:hypothetical protein